MENHRRGVLPCKQISKLFREFYKIKHVEIPSQLSPPIVLVDTKTTKRYPTTAKEIQLPLLKHLRERNPDIIEKKKTRLGWNLMNIGIERW